MDVVLGLFNNPVVLTVIGLVVKFVPGIRTVVANKLIPYLLAAVAWLSQVMGPEQAHAAGGPLVVAASFFGLGGVLGGLGAAVWQSAQAWALNEMFLRHHLPPKPVDSR